MNQLLREYAMWTTNEGRMENMSQLLKKCALLAVCAALALCFTTRAAHAQAVAASGTGEHLIFPYWTTDSDTSTLVAVRSPLGLRTSTADETMNVVKIMVRDDMGEQAVSFNICLTPGDSWTAMLSADGLMVGDAGGCDANVAQSPGDRGTPATSTPAAGAMLSLGDAMSGYLEAWVAPTSGLIDNSVPCTATGANCVAVGGPDTDLLPENATPRYIAGVATMVSATSGFSSTYNAVALTGCGVSGSSAPIAAAGDNGNGCWQTNGAAADGAPITTALNGLNQDILIGRWTAISDANVDSSTTVVLTFPVNHLNYKGTLTDADGEVEGTDPVSVLAFDDAGQIAIDSREVMLGKNVNMCMFGMSMDDDMSTGDDMGDDMGDATGDDMDSGPMLSCNGTEMGALDGTAGEFRIFNNKLANVSSTATSVSH